MIQGSVRWALLELGVLRTLQAASLSVPALLIGLEEMGLDAGLPELYPLLQRLVKEGLLTTWLHVAPGGRRSRRYGLTRLGHRTVEETTGALWRLGGRIVRLQG